MASSVRLQKTPAVKNQVANMASYVEMKARVERESIEELLRRVEDLTQSQGTHSVQEDTYFHSTKGRLKLRQRLTVSRLH